MNERNATKDSVNSSAVRDTLFLVDADIPYADMLFDGLGQVEFFDAADPLRKAAVLECADVLAVRSATKVGAGMLAGCRNLKVLATPVVGTDHIDFDAVDGASGRLGRDINVINAAGSTADAVADWAVGAMRKVLGRVPASVGIVGAGSCGTAVAERLGMLGVGYVLNDPPKMAAYFGAANCFVSAPIEEILACEVITFHVPLARPDQSAWPTADMITPGFALAARACGCRLIVNCARGGIMDEAVAALSADERPALACDVFKNEPSPSVDFVRACAIATPHIAGSGRIGRLNAAAMIRRQVCDILKIGPATLPTADDLFCDIPEINPSNFLCQIEQLSGLSIAADFKLAWLASTPAERPALFNTFRALGIRTEPTWTR